MQVTKLSMSGNDGLVPAGRYFARLAENLSANNARAAANIQKSEAQERRLEARFRKRAAHKTHTPSTLENLTHA